MSIIKLIFAVSEEVRPRTIPQVMLKLAEEQGELAKEVNIVEGFVNKPEGEDGIVGEAVDLIICAVDVIKLAAGATFTEEELEQIFIKKLTKWKHNDSIRVIG